MPRGRKPNGDRYCSEAHLRFLRKIADRVAANVGPWIQVDELVAVGWLQCLRHAPGPDFTGMGTNIYRAMFRYASKVLHGVPRKQWNGGVRVSNPPGAADSIEERRGFDHSQEDRELCLHILDRMKPTESQLLRAIYIEGRSQADIAAECGRTPSDIAYHKRRAIDNARRIAHLALEGTTGQP